MSSHAMDAEYRSQAAQRFYQGQPSNTRDQPQQHPPLLQARAVGEAMSLPVGAAPGAGPPGGEAQSRDTFPWCCQCSFGMAIGGILILCGVLIMFIYFSVASLPPNQFGLLFNIINNHVDGDTVYRGGLHLVWPYRVLLPFPAVLKTIEYSDNHVVEGATYAAPLKTRSPEGLALVIHAALQYQLIREELPLLYRVANRQYEQLFIANARDVLLKAASEFKANEYWSRRGDIGEEFQRRVNVRLEELHARCVHFEVLRVDLPRDWEEKIVATQVAQQQIETEKMKQQAARIRASTSVMSSEYDRRRMIIISEANAKSTLLIKTAEAHAQQSMLNIESKTLEYARSRFPSANATQLVDMHLGMAYKEMNNATFLLGLPPGTKPLIGPMINVPESENTQTSKPSLAAKQRPAPITMQKGAGASQLYQKRSQ